MAYDFIDDDLKKKIKRTKFVLMVTRPGTGKTFSGDCLEDVRGWKHVDGDMPAKKRRTNPEWRAASEQMFGFGKFAGITHFMDGILENQKPYFEILARLTLEAARDSNKVVMTFNAYLRSSRGFFRGLLRGAGARDVSTVFLHCDPKLHARALWDRLNRKAIDSGIPLREHLRFWNAEHIEDFESFCAWFQEVAPLNLGFQEADDSEQPYSVVDVTAEDEMVLDRLDAVFGIGTNESRGEEIHMEFFNESGILIPNNSKSVWTSTRSMRPVPSRR